MIYGYARVSSYVQNLDRQKSSLKKEGCTKIFEEKISGTTLDRPKLKRLISIVEKGDVIIVHSLDRICRSTVDLLQLVYELRKKGVALRSVNNSWLDTTDDNPFSEFLLTVMSGLSQYERKMINIRQTKSFLLHS
ncbi:recombinase family protein [Gracilibacillus dipsosauri]|uniref:recombinase family protein n=1 Tax=Gracilibacillus dipsosauri TaxID=178340 RepID=UPI0024090992